MKYDTVAETQILDVLNSNNLTVEEMVGTLLTVLVDLVDGDEELTGEVVIAMEEAL